MCEHVLRIFAAMIRCFPADSESQKFLGRADVHVAIPGQHGAILRHQYVIPVQMLNGTVPDLLPIGVIDARSLVHIEAHTTKFELKAVKDRLFG